MSRNIEFARWNSDITMREEGFLSLGWCINRGISSCHLPRAALRLWALSCTYTHVCNYMIVLVSKYIKRQIANVSLPLNWGWGRVGGFRIKSRCTNDVNTIWNITRARELEKLAARCDDRVSRSGWNCLWQSTRRLVVRFAFCVYNNWMKGFAAGLKG